MPDSTDVDDDKYKIKKPRKKESPYSIQNALWLIAAVATIYYTDFAFAIFTNPKVVR